MIDFPTPFQPSLPTSSKVASNPVPPPLPPPVFHYPHTPKGLRTPLRGDARPCTSLFQSKLEGNKL